MKMEKNSRSSNNIIKSIMIVHKDSIVAMWEVEVIEEVDIIEAITTKATTAEDKAMEDRDIVVVEEEVDIMKEVEEDIMKEVVVEEDILTSTSSKITIEVVVDKDIKKEKITEKQSRRSRKRIRWRRMDLR